MSTHHSSEMTLFPNPLHTSELRALPQYRIGNGSVLRGESLQELFRVQQIMRDLVPTGVDDTRTLWIETLRGDPAEWGDYDYMLKEGLVSSHGEYLEQWELFNPDEVVWWRVSISSYNDKHALIITDEEDSYTLLCNRKMPSDFFKEEEREEFCPDVKDTLSQLGDYLYLVVNSIVADPETYNSYLEEHLPHRFRTGVLPLREYRRLTGDDPCRELTDEDMAFLEQKTSETEKDCVMECPMTLGLYARTWMIGYRALYKGYEGALDKQGFRDEFDAFRVLSRCGSSTDGCNPNKARDFDRWLGGARPAHGCEYPHGGIALYPERTLDGSLLILNGQGEKDITKVIRIARALEKANIRVVVRGADAMLRFVRGDSVFTFDPRGEASFATPRRRFPARATEGMPQEVIDSLDKATAWEPLKRVYPMKDLLREDRDRS